MIPKDEPWRWIREIEENVSGLSEFCFNCGWHKIENGKLGDIAPTILQIMGVDIPTEMTGAVLIK